MALIYELFKKNILWKNDKSIPFFFFFGQLFIFSMKVLLKFSEYSLGTQ